MKKIYSFVIVSLIAMTVNAQLVFNENFTTGFTNGNLGTQGSWVQSDNGQDVTISNETPLTYPGYTSGTQYAMVYSADGTDPRKLFSTSIGTGSGRTIFLSFVVRVTYAELSDEGPDYSVALFNTGDNARPLRFYIAEEPTDNGQLRFGIATGSENTPNWTSTAASYQFNTTYLIVIRYDIFTGSMPDNDDAYLWVNPNLSSIPSIAPGGPAASMLNGNETGFGSTLNALLLSQTDNEDSPDAAYDGFRVAHGATANEAWTNLAPAGAPLPVQLTSFNASEEGLSTKLVWNTVDEHGVATYVIEKSTDGRNYTAVGTVKAANLRSYNFTDAASAENSYYRLKIVDVDGTYKYSYIVSVKAKLNTSILLSPNPVKTSLMIQHPKAGISSHIQILGATGQLLKDIRLSANAVISNVDMSGFTSGLYHVVYKNGSEMFSKTVLKQ